MASVERENFRESNLHLHCALYPLIFIIDIDVNLQNALISTNDILGIADTSL
jgi:hypothetical protein